MKKIWILTLFPSFIKEFMSVGVIGQALTGKRGPGLEINVVDIREYGLGNYKAVDDTPYGGGPGMIMRADCLKETLFKGVVIPGKYDQENLLDLHVIYTSARGTKWKNSEVKIMAKKIENMSGPDLVFICGRYEGIDERFIAKYVNEEICLGEFILSGGELAVLSILDSSLRYVDGILGNKLSYSNDSFENGLLEYPQYTRPAIFEGAHVPEVLTSGHHKKIDEFNQQESLRVTNEFRPDILEKD